LEQEIWLEDDDNLQRWEDGSLTASDRRVLITMWLGQAWDNLQCKPGFSSRIRRYFQKTGCLLTANDSDDNKLQPQGTSGYSFVSDSVSHADSDIESEDSDDVRERKHASQSDAESDDEEDISMDESGKMSQTRITRH
jgi:hypothetical protein